MIWKVHHYILELKVPVDDEHRHHVVEPSNQLPHYGLHDAWAQLVVFEIHHFFKIVTVAQLHEYIIPGVRFNRFPHLNDKLAQHGILILNFTDDELFFGPAQS